MPYHSAPAVAEDFNAGALTIPSRDQAEPRSVPGWAVVAGLRSTLDLRTQYGREPSLAILVIMKPITHFLVCVADETVSPKDLGFVNLRTMSRDGL